MKKTVISLLLMLCICTAGISAQAATLIPVGQVVGLELADSTVTVAALEEDPASPARAADIRPGDRLLSVNDTPIKQPEDVRRALDRSRGPVTLTLSRQGKALHCELEPRITPSGPKLGLYLKQGVTGIGTVTFYDPATGRFGALGHGVNGPDGKLLHMLSGRAYRANVASVVPGKAGKPGQLRGNVYGDQPVGTLVQNTAQGVFGTAQAPFSGKTLETAPFETVKTGKATILSTVSGDSVQEYSVEILKIYPRGKLRNLMIRVTDSRLLETTGGIVQGMGVSYNRDNQWNP